MHAAAQQSTPQCSKLASFGSTAAAHPGAAVYHKVESPASKHVHHYSALWDLQLPLRLHMHARAQ